MLGESGRRPDLSPEYVKPVVVRRNGYARGMRERNNGLVQKRTSQVVNKGSSLFGKEE
jgi:hypothetical protein